MASTKDFKAFGQDIQKRLTDLESKTASMLTKTTADGLYLGKTATATAASKLTTNAGSLTNPVYFANGIPVKTTHTLEASVPANAKFTDTWRGIQDNLTSTSTTDSLSANQGKILKDSLDTKLSAETVLLDLNTFAKNNHVYRSSIDNVLYKAGARYTVTAENLSNLGVLFDSNTNSFLTVAAGKKAVILLKSSVYNFGWDYPYGKLYLSWYNTRTLDPSKVSMRVYQNWTGHNVGWVDCGHPVVDTDKTDYANGVMHWNMGTYGIEQIEITLDNTAGTEGVDPMLIEYFCNRTNIHSLPVVTKWGGDTIQGTLSAKDGFIGNLTGNANTATKATADASGNNIVNTYAKKTDVYTKSEVDSKVSGIYSYKGTVESYDKLPTTGVKTGDVYNIGTALDGKNYAAIVDSEGKISWDDIGGKVDLSSYITKTDAESAYLGKTATAASAIKLSTARAIALSGDVTGTADFDGSKAIEIAATLKNSGVTAGTYGPTAATTLGYGGSVNIPYTTFDAQGRATKAGHYAITLPAAPTSVSGNAGSATKLATAHYIDGVSFNGTADIANYGTCATAAATKDKVVACTGFALKTGARIIVKFTVTNTVTPTADAPITLNVNGTGAKSIFYHNSAVFSAGYLSAGRAIEFVYDGTQYIVVGDWDTNTKYNKGTYNTLGLIKPSKSYTGAATLTTAAATATTAPTVAAISTTAGRYYAVEQDVNGVPFVNVPWANNTYSNMTAATTSDAGKAGLVPAPAAGAQEKFLRGDGTWQVPTNTNNAVTQTVKTDNVNYPIIAKGTNATATITGGVNFAAAITLNPSTGTINATKFNGELDAANLTGTIDGGTL